MPSRRSALLTSAQALLLKLTLFGLALTGVAQMPIFKRYYIADLPGLGWLADFHATSVMHYGFAAVLLFIAGYLAAVYVAAGRRTAGKLSAQPSVSGGAPASDRAPASGRPPASGARLALTGAGRLKLGLFALVIASGAAHAAGNLPGVSLSPGLAMAADLAHLASAMLLGLAALAARLAGRAAWLRVR